MSHAREPSRGRSSHKQKPLGNHQSSWIWGRHLVHETLTARRWPVLELWLADDLSELEFTAAESLARLSDIPIKRAPRRNLISRCRGEDHQGYAALMGEFPYATTEDCFQAATGWPLTIALDRIQDPYNFGTMLRSAEIFGAAGVIIGSVEQVGVTSQVARSSVGAVNRLPIARVPSLATYLKSMPGRTVSVIAASEKSSTPIMDFDFRQPVLLVIGNEGRGISPEVLEHCPTSVRIPQQGTINSLNASAALAIICYEIRRQQGMEASK